MVLTIINRFLVTSDFFELNLKFLYLVGLWPDKNVSETKFNLYKIYERTLHSFMLIYFVISGIKTVESTNEIIAFLSNIDISVVSYNYFFKVVFFVAKREKLKVLIDDIIQSRDTVTDKNRDKMIKLLVIITSLCSFVLSIFSISALFNNEMPIDSWMPFDPYKNKVNLIISAQIILALFAVPFFYRAMGMQGMVCSLLIYLCDQLQTLQKRILNLKYTKGNEIRMRDELKSIIRKHIRLLGYSNSLEGIFKEYFLIQNVAVTLELCINAVLVTNITLDQISILFGFIVYLALALLNSYIYCSLGSDLIEQSEGIAQAAYDSDWSSWPVDLQKNLLLIITVAQRPFKMSTGGISVVNMQNYGTALYNGYSIFAVLSDAVN